MVQGSPGRRKVPTIGDFGQDSIICALQETSRAKYQGTVASPHCFASGPPGLSMILTLGGRLLLAVSSEERHPFPRLSH
jgi:non-ribosomal peptide synthetase component E (peptide arylation enzyme)